MLDRNINDSRTKHFNNKCFFTIYLRTRMSSLTVKCCAVGEGIRPVLHAAYLLSWRPGNIRRLSDLFHSFTCQLVFTNGSIVRNYIIAHAVFDYGNLLYAERGSASSSRADSLFYVVGQRSTFNKIQDSTYESRTIYSRFSNRISWQFF